MAVGRQIWPIEIDCSFRREPYTTLIAGVALLTFGSGPVRGFAVVHCLGILTSIFSAVFVSRAIVNLVYGSRRKLQSISIGQIWRPTTTAAK